MTDFRSKAAAAMLLVAGAWISASAYPIPAAEMAGVPDLNGSIVYSSNFIPGNPDIGIYRLPKGAGKSPDLLLKGPDASAGGVYADGYFYSTTYLNLWGFFVVTTQKWDMRTYTMVYEYDGDMTNVPLGGAAVDPLTKDIYGIFLNSTADGYVFGKIAYGASSMTTTPISPLPGSWNAMAIDRDGVIYGISMEADIDQETGNYTVTRSYLNTIDRNTGAVTRIGLTGERP